MKNFYFYIAILFMAILLPFNGCTAEKEQGLSIREQAIIFLILQNTHEVSIHQMNGEIENQVFLGPNGHKEAVYNKQGKLVSDGINDGSYNYNHPIKEPLLHFNNDIHPWIIMGHSRSDTTIVKQRIYAYMGDLEGGISRAHKQRKTLSKLQSTLSFTKKQKEALNHWAFILKNKDTAILFSYFDLNRSMNDDEIISVLTAINKAFEDAY